VKGGKHKPPAMQAVLGNPGKRPLNVPAPGALPPAELQPPAHLTESAARVWLELAPMLEAVDVLSGLSTHALAGFCVPYARWLDAEAALAEEGEIIKAPSGYPIPNPWRAVANKAWEHWMKAAVEFGLTPSALVRVGARLDTKGAADPADRFFSGPRVVSG